MAKTRPRNPPRKRDRAPVEAPEDLAAEQSDPHRGPWTDEEKALYFGAPEETPIARRDAAILGLSRQAEELGISVVNLLSGLLLAEHDVLRFERNGKMLEWRRFSRTIETARRLRVEHSAIEEEARAIARETNGPFIILGRNPDERLSEKQQHQEDLAARKAKLEERRKKLEEGRSALAEEWKALHVLPEIIQKVHSSLECWRVRYALEWLRASRLLYAEKDLPPELRKLLDLIGNKVAHPKKYTGWKQSEREKAILGAWNAREWLGRAAMEAAAARLFPPNKRAPNKRAKGERTDAVEKLEREARRYIARARAKEARPAGRGRAGSSGENG
jgi:hypothetical protein